MTEEELAAMEAREKAATLGPWHHTFKDCKHFMNSTFIDRDGDDRGVGLVTCDINQDNATLYATNEDMDFIAAAREDVPKLIAEVRRLRNAIKSRLRTAEKEHEMTGSISAAIVASILEDILDNAGT